MRLGSLANLYHEAILWGLCGALWGVYFALRLFVLHLRRHGQPLPAVAGRVALALLPALAAGLLQLWYNHARFGSPLAFAPFEGSSGPRPAGVDSPFHWSRIPSGAWAYCRLSLDFLGAPAPFITFAHPKVLRPELYRDLTTLLISPLLVSPWLVLSTVGAWLLPAEPGARRRLVLCALPFAAQALLFLAYYWLAYRFTAEFLPLWLLFLAVYLRRAAAGSGASRLLSPRAFALAVGLSVLATAASTLHFQSRWWAYPAEYRLHLSHLFEALNRLVTGL